MKSKGLIISYDFLIKILLFLYFCGMNAHKRGYGFDAWFCRITFIVLIGVECIYVKNNRRVIINSVFQWYLGFVMIYIFSSLWSVNVNDIFAREIINNFVQILGVMLVISVHFHTDDDFRIGFKLLLWSLLYMTILLVIRTPISDWGLERVGNALALNSNDLGIRSAVAVALSVYFAKGKKVYYLTTILFGIVALLSGSRKAFLMIILELTFFLLTKNKGWKKIVSIALIIVGCGLIIYASFNIPALYNVLGSRLERTFYTMMGTEVRNQYGTLIEDHSGIQRAEMRQMAIGYFFDHPILGLGGNGFVSKMREVGYSLVAYSHCNYTEILSTLGIVGFIYYNYKPVSNIICGVRWIKAYKTKDSLFSMALIIGVIFMIIDYYSVSYYSVFSLIVLALIISYMEIHYKAEIEQKE